MMTASPASAAPLSPLPSRLGWVPTRTVAWHIWLLGAVQSAVQMIGCSKHPCYFVLPAFNASGDCTGRLTEVVILAMKLL